MVDAVQPGSRVLLEYQFQSTEINFALALRSTKHCFNLVSGTEKANHMYYKCSSVINSEQHTTS